MRLFIAFLLSCAGLFAQSSGSGRIGGTGTQLFVTNAQTSTYQVLIGDFQYCKTIPVSSGTFTITLVASTAQPANGQCLRVLNYGSGVVTVAPSGQNLNGSGSTLTIPAGTASTANGLWIVSDGTNYEAQPVLGSDTAGGLTGTSVTSTSPVTANANSTSDQQLMELALGAGYLNSAGQPFLFNAAGVYSTQTGQTPTLTLKVKLCTVSGCGSGTVVTLVSIVSTASTLSTTNQNWNMSFMGYTATTGSSGNLEIHGPLVVDLGATTATADSVFGDTNTAASSTINLTGALYVDFTIAFSTQPTTPFNTMTQRAGGVMPFAATAAPVTSVFGQTGAVAAPAALGSSTATTQSAGDNSTKVATTAYVDGKSTILPLIVPAANCNAGTAGAGWSTASSNFTAACRAGSNNLNGTLQAIPSTGASAQFNLELPANWVTGTQPYINIFYASGANTSGTVIWTASSACSKADGTITDDPAFNAESAFASQTMTTANRGWSQTGQFTAITSGNNCVPGGTLIIKVALSGTASSNINVSKAVITMPVLNTVQAQ